MDILDKALDYIKKTGFDVDKNREHWGYFGNEWKKYLKVRNILDGVGPAKFPEKFGVEERDSFYQSLSYSGWGGSSGHDAPMIAYSFLFFFLLFFFLLFFCLFFSFFIFSYFHFSFSFSFPFFIYRNNDNK